MDYLLSSHGKHDRHERPSNSKAGGIAGIVGIGLLLVRGLSPLTPPEVTTLVYFIWVLAGGVWLLRRAAEEPMGDVPCEAPGQREVS